MFIVKQLLPVLFIIAVLLQRSGVPVPGGISAVTGGTDSVNRRRTDKRNTAITRPVSESRVPGFSF